MTWTKIVKRKEGGEEKREEKGKPKYSEFFYLLNNKRSCKTLIKSAVTIFVRKGCKVLSIQNINRVMKAHPFKGNGPLCEFLKGF